MDTTLTRMIGDSIAATRSVTRESFAQEIRIRVGLSRSAKLDAEQILALFDAWSKEIDRETGADRC